MPQKKIQLNDRVKRSNGEGSQGIVKDVREEITLTTGDKERGLLIGVMWDNGTVSYFAPEGLEVVQQ